MEELGSALAMAAELEREREWVRDSGVIEL
jgi:hypothetical protein